MKAADLADRAMLALVRELAAGEPLGAKLLDVEARLPDVPPKVILAKLRILERRGLVSGCCCGCRGDFTATAAGLDLLGRS